VAPLEHGIAPPRPHRAAQRQRQPGGEGDDPERPRQRPADQRPDRHQQHAGDQLRDAHRRAAQEGGKGGRAFHRARYGGRL
jgi:hypothetical protein